MRIFDTEKLRYRNFISKVKKQKLVYLTRMKIFSKKAYYYVMFDLHKNLIYHRRESFYRTQNSRRRNGILAQVENLLQSEAYFQSSRIHIYFYFAWAARGHGLHKSKERGWPKATGPGYSGSFNRFFGLRGQDPGISYLSGSSRGDEKSKEKNDDDVPWVHKGTRKWYL